MQWCRVSWGLTYSVHSIGVLLLCKTMLNWSVLCLSSPPMQFPDTCEESASPFVFICTNPQELLVKFPIKGKHKICKSHFHVRELKWMKLAWADWGVLLFLFFFLWVFFFGLVRSHWNNDKSQRFLMLHFRFWNKITHTHAKCYTCRGLSESHL